VNGARRPASRSAVGPVIDKVHGGAYLSRDLFHGAKKDVIAVVFRAFVVIIV
jgi:hypothetical protein